MNIKPQNHVKIHVINVKLLFMYLLKGKKRTESRIQRSRQLYTYIYSLKNLLMVSGIQNLDNDDQVKSPKRTKTIFRVQFHYKRCSVTLSPPIFYRPQFALVSSESIVDCFVNGTVEKLLQFNLHTDKQSILLYKRLCYHNVIAFNKR